MSLQLEQIPIKNEHSFRSKIDVLPHIEVAWHYHPEFELIYIEKSQGTLIVGDCIDKFTDGDMIFLGPNIPHVMKNEEAHYQKNPDLHAIAWVVHFKEDSFGKEFFLIPEMYRIKSFLKKSFQGVRIDGSTKYKIIQHLKTLHASDFSQRIIILLQILQILAQSDDLEYLASKNFVESFQQRSNQKLYKIYEYVSANFQQKIELEEAAKLANMSKTAFCRFFKSKTKKTFSEFLNEMRINYSKKLLAEGSLTVSQIAYECGFNSPSYFNKQFKALTGKAPLQLRGQGLESFSQ
ncbi:AraC family transcriptional regulator [Labilibaculum sp. DW002]|uniref:AraC family transcriptional regulator n=1 Tax=Paralabilibaculum antarcticum TaxID=2912572 RepID=A0ABT5VVF9_9BACT|nr:AraC family transcriptional regulator [Labilibaculum sp. DW002]MDE5419394.1 AraC family transcriptional regulator [Labilibaculum sp. DW002]